MRRAAAFARNLVLLARTGARQAADDPALLAVQTLRRLPPGVRGYVSRRLVARSGAAPVRTAMGHFLADHPDLARVALDAARPRSGFAQRVAAELAVTLGEEAPADAAPTVRARAAWLRGDISAAVSIASASPTRAAQRYAAVVTSERDLLAPGHSIAPRPAPSMLNRREDRGDASRPPPSQRPLHLLTNSLPWTQSGYSLRSHAILRSQAEAGMAVEALTRAGYPVVVGLPQARDTDVVDGITYRRVLSPRLAATPTGRLEQTATALMAAATAHGASVLHTTTHYPNAITAQAAARELGLPWVYEVRGQLEKTWLAARPEPARAESARSERYRLARARESELAGAADHVVTLSEALRADLIGRGVAAERLSVVPNGVEAALLDDRTPPGEARRRLGLPDDGFWVGTVSSLVDYEGLDTLVDAVALLRRRGLDVRCAIVGDGVARPSLLAQARDLRLDRHAVLPGRVPRDQAPLWHRALDAFVVPRRNVEVCRTVTPLKPIEAMAAGRPVLASRLPALSEIIEEPETGLLFTADDAEALAVTLAGLLEDPVLRATLGTNGRAFAATRTWAAMGKRYRTIYEDLGNVAA